MSTNLPRVSLYTDGSCIKNPGPGGWAYILVHEGNEKKDSGCEQSSTNSRMEIKAVLEGLRALKKPCAVKIYSDSEYVINTIEKWLEGWKKQRFKGKANVDLWREYIELSKDHKISTKHIKAHTGHKYNERCDKMALAAARSVILDDGSGSLI